MQNLTQTPVVRSALILCISAVLGFAFNYLFYKEWVGVNVPVFVGLVALVYCGFVLSIRQKIPHGVWFLFIPLLIYAIFASIRSSEFLTFLNIVASLYLLALIADWTRGGKLAAKMRDWLTPFFVMPFIFLMQSIFAFSGLFSGKQAGGHKKFQMIARGMVMALPVLIVFSLLFASADLVFQKIVKDIFSFEITAELITQSLIVGIVTIVFAGAWQYIFFGVKKTEAPEVNILPRKIGKQEMTVFFGLVNALVLAFIAIQIRYLFGGSSALASLGLTYAEYARKGFFELIVVAVLTLSIVWAAQKSVELRDGRTPVMFRMLATLLLAEVGMVLVSAAKRLGLYEDAYGFTESRFYAHVVILWLAVVMLCVVYYLWRMRQESMLFHAVFVGMLLALGGINIINPHAFIANRNIARYEEGTAALLDVWYLNRLSDDAMPRLVAFLENSPDWKDEHKSLARELYWRTRSRRENTPFISWKSSHVARANAEKALAAIIAKLEPYKEYSSVAWSVLNTVPKD